MDEVDALVSFYESWRANGVGDDGLPLYEQVVMIRMAKPPLLMVEEPATEDHEEQFADAWRMFQKSRKVRDLTVKGYPLAFWPIVSPADLQTLVVRDIVTVEQLAKAKTRDMPTQLQELCDRAAKLVKLQGGAAKHEALLKDRDARIEALEEQVKDASTTIASLRSTIDQLRIRGAS